MRLLTTLLAGLLCHSLQASAAETSVADKLKQRLGPLLSKDAVLNFPSSDSWGRLTERWAGPLIHPDYIAVVEVATEADVQNAIKIANGLDIPFLTVSGGHGFTNQVNNVKKGLSINMRKLNTAVLNRSSQTVTVGGGILAHELLSFLDSHGKQTVHAVCQCVSVVGPMLGGAHSLLQGEKGFAADNLVSARVVLADGSVVVASDKKNKELFWGLRGAGHNFGVVTSAEVKTFDVPAKAWTIVTLWFKGDKLEKVLETWNKLEDKYADPGLLILNGHISRNAEIDAVNPVIDLGIIYQGDRTVADKYLAAFRALGAAKDTTQANIPWRSLHDEGGFGHESPLCQGGLNFLTAPNSVSRWEPASMRAGYKVFAEATSDPRFAFSSWILESYGRKGPQTFPAGFNAVAPEERENHILMSASFLWDGPAVGEVAETATKHVTTIREITRSKVSKPHTYVNYSPWSSPLQEVFGRDPGRVERLKALKKQWDPKNKFGYYSGIA